MPNSGLLIASHQSHLPLSSYRHNRLFSVRSVKIFSVEQPLLWLAGMAPPDKWPQIG
jgi:hypothetical protein